MISRRPLHSPYMSAGQVVGEESEPEVGERVCRLEPFGAKWNPRRQIVSHVGKGYLV